MNIDFPNYNNNTTTTSNIVATFPPPGWQLPTFTSEENLNHYIKAVIDHNQWMDLEQYKIYLKYCEAYYPQDKIYAYHQKAKWKDDLVIYQKSGIFDENK